MLGHRGFGSGEHLVHRADLSDTAGVDDRNALTDLLDDRHLVRDDDDGDAERLVDLLEQGEDGAGGRRVERARGLVAQQDLRVGGQRTGDGDALLLTAGELRRIVARAVGEADDLEQLLRALFCVRLARSRDLEREADILERGALLEQVELLKDHAHRAARLEQLLFRETAELLTVHGDGACGRLFEKVDAAHERGFACTGQTDDAENFAAADVEVDAVERRDLAGSAGECFVETSDANDSVLFQVHSS